MQSGLLFRWGKPMAGREGEAVDLFQEVLGYFELKKKEGAITYFEPFLFSTADFDLETGFMLVKGPIAELFKMFDDDHYKEIITKSSLLIGHFRVDFLRVDEEIVETLGRYGKMRAQLGI